MILVGRGANRQKNSREYSEAFVRVPSVEVSRESWMRVVPKLLALRRY